MAALPFLVFRAKRVGAGVFAVVASFALFHLGITLVYLWMRNDLVPATIVAVITFLVAVIISRRR